MTGQDSQIYHVWTLTEKIRVCMLTTLSGGAMRARPMHALPDRERGCLWFITDQRGAKDDEIKAAPEVCLAFAETSSNTYLSVTVALKLVAARISGQPPDLGDNRKVQMT